MLTWVSWPSIHRLDRCFRQQLFGIRHRFDVFHVILAHAEDRVSPLTSSTSTAPAKYIILSRKVPKPGIVLRILKYGLLYDLSTSCCSVVDLGIPSVGRQDRVFLESHIISRRAECSQSPIVAAHEISP